MENQLSQENGDGRFVKINFILIFILSCILFYYSKKKTSNTNKIYLERHGHFVGGGTLINSRWVFLNYLTKINLKFI